MAGNGGKWRVYILLKPTDAQNLLVLRAQHLRSALTQQLQQMEPNTPNNGSVRSSRFSGKTLGERSEYRVFGFGRRRNRYSKPVLLSKGCRLPPMSSLSPPSPSERLSEGRRPPLVSNISPPLLGEHVGSPLLGDRSSGEPVEVGDIEVLSACHRIPSSTGQYRLPNEVECPENDWWAELSRAENGDSGGLTGGNHWSGVDVGPDPCREPRVAISNIDRPQLAPVAIDVTVTSTAGALVDETHSADFAPEFAGAV